MTLCNRFCAPISFKQYNGTLIILLSDSYINGLFLCMIKKNEFLLTYMKNACVSIHPFGAPQYLTSIKKRPPISEWSCNSVRYWIRIRIRTEHESVLQDLRHYPS
jgi:hypothetical protein